MLKLLKENDVFLKGQTREIDFSNVPEDLVLLSQNMISFIRENDGIGLAAPQIGLDYKMFVIAVGGKDLVVINPSITGWSRQLNMFKEGCLSFPNLYLNIRRPETIEVSYYNENGENIVREMGGLLCRCFQHEYDHLNGITFDTLASSLSLDMAKKKRAKELKKTMKKERN